MPGSLKGFSKDLETEQLWRPDLLMLAFSEPKQILGPFYRSGDIPFWSMSATNDPCSRRIGQEVRPKTRLKIVSTFLV